MRGSPAMPSCCTSTVSMPAASTPDLSPLKDLQVGRKAMPWQPAAIRSAAGRCSTPWRDDRDLLDAPCKAQLGIPGEIVPFGGSLGGLLALKLAEDPGSAAR